jgi:uncharacterized protein (DUF488 family)
VDEPPVIFTIGHSTRSLVELIDLLGTVGVRELVDVRSVPRSRRHLHFSEQELSRTLPARGISYAHEGALGGFRRPRPHSLNGGWQHLAFRGYADHMADEDFLEALQRLEAAGREQATCVMCAEAHWRRCHRRLISDALLIRGWRVLHLGVQPQPTCHEMTPFAVAAGERTLTYPPLQAQLPIAAVTRATPRPEDRDQRCGPRSRSLGRAGDRAAL